MVDQLVTTQPAVSTRNQILPVGTSDSIGLCNNIAVPGTTGTFVLPVGSNPVRVDRYGNLHGGMNYLLSPYPRNNTQTSCADFLYDQTMLRFCTRSIMLTQLGDPADYSGTRFGPGGCAPYGKPAGAVGTPADMTGLGPGTSVVQFRGCPAAVPYGGNPGIGGGQGIAEVTAGTVSYATDEMPRYLKPSSHDNMLDLAVGFRLDFFNTPNGYDGRQPYTQAQLSAAGNLRIGWNSIYNMTDSGRLQLRNEIGVNEVFSLVPKGTVSGGTLTLTHYGVPPVSPAFVGVGNLTDPFPWNATAAQVEAAYQAVPSIGPPVVLAGTVSTANSGGNTIVTAISGTSFLTDFVVGDFATIVGVDYYVSAVTATTLTVLGNAGSIASTTLSRPNVVCYGPNLDQANGSSIQFLPNQGTTALMIHFCGLARNTHFVRPLASENLLTGGGWITVGHAQYALASGADKLLIRAQHGGRGTPTASYYQFLDGANNVVSELNNLGQIIGTAPTQAPGDNSTKLANTAFVAAAVAAGGGGAGALTVRSSKATADTSMSAANAYTDLADSGGVGGAVAVSLTPGTWFVWGMVCMNDTSASAGVFQARITDGSNHYASGIYSRRPNAGEAGTIAMIGVVVVGTTTTVKLQAAGSIGTTTVAKAALSTNPTGNNATQLLAFKVA